MAGVVVVGEEEEMLEFALVDEGAGDFGPAVEVGGAVNDDFVPGHGERFDFLAVAEPADVGKIGGDEIEISFHFPGTRNPGLVDEGESDAVFAKEIGEAGIEPPLVADFDGEPIAGRKRFKEGLEAIEKI